MTNAILYGEKTDLLIDNGKILMVGPSGSLDIPSNFSNLRHVDAESLILFPSFIDVHTHLREPGFEYKEDIESGLRSAAYGGFGAVMPMANTFPINDKAAVSRFMIEKAEKHWPHGPKLYPVGALSVGLKGEELAPYGELAEAGCVAISNDGRPVKSSEIFRRAMEYAAQWDLKVIDHCEDPTLASGWVMNEGTISGTIGVKGQPVVGESLQVARDILLAEYLNIPLHLAHISCRQSVDLIAWAKERGVPVTAETCPHYLKLDDSALSEYDSLAKVSPPLRTADDVEAITQGLIDGVIDILATDHAPHAAHEKEVTLDEAPYGFIGLELALPLTYDLVREGRMTEEKLVKRWVNAPAKAFKLPFNSFKEGDEADFFLFNPDKEWEVNRKNIKSKSMNTPYLGKTLRGRVEEHWMGGFRLLDRKE